MSHHHHHGNQGFNQEQGGFNQNQGLFGHGVGDFVHLLGGNFGQHGASYAIQSSMGKVLDICQSNSHGNHPGDLILYDFYGGKNQRFTITKQGQDVIIRSVQNGQVLQAHDGWLHQHQGKGHVRQEPFNNSQHQKWRIRKAHNQHNQYYIINVADGKVLDVEGANNSNNNKVIVYPFNGQKNQLWSIVPCGPGETKLPGQSWW